MALDQQAAQPRLGTRKRWIREAGLGARFWKCDRDRFNDTCRTAAQYVHLAWRQNHADLKDLPFPMVADTKRELSTALGILHKQDGVPLRATFIVDPQGIIRFASVNDLSVGRNVDEVLRVLDALQTDELCPCNWEKGQPTLQV